MSLAEIGIKDQYFGMEDEMTGITRAEAASAIAEHFGTRAIHVGGSYDKWTVRDPEGKEWTLMSDASIKLVIGLHCLPIILAMSIISLPPTMLPVI